MSIPSVKAVPDMQPVIHKGLEGVAVDTTSTSLVDGEAGKLYYRGYPIETMAKYRFTEAAYLLVFGELPTPAQLTTFKEYLWHAGQLPAELVASLQQLTSLGAHPMAVLQGITPFLTMDPPEVRMGRSPDEEEGLLCAARMPMAIATIHAAMQGWDAPTYPRTRSYGERFLELMHQRTPTAEQVKAFERTQILQIDHNMNASTFASRVATSTLAPVSSAMSAAVGTLYGPLHGAADQGALEMAYEVGTPEKAEAFVANCLGTGRRVMGMGHREYRVVDPRAFIITDTLKSLVTEPEHRRVLETLMAVEKAFSEQTAKKSRPLRANMEFYKGVVYLALGIPKEFFTTMFAAARAFGWTAHIVEQRKDNRLIRPDAPYIGPAPR
jgi:citrate synthase